MSLFLRWGPPFKKVDFVPEMAKHGSRPKGPKGTQIVNLSVFAHFGPFWAHLNPFGPFQTKIDFLLQSTSAKPYFVHLGQKKSFLSEMVHIGTKGSQMVKTLMLAILVHFRPFWTTLER